MKSQMAQMAQIIEFVQRQDRSVEIAYRSEIDCFARSHKDFEKRRPRMAKLLQAGRASTLAEAYRLAAPKRAKKAGK